MSQGLFYLKDTDFELRSKPKGPVLCTRSPGYALVLFYSPKCKHSAALLPVFKKLPGSVGGCTFALCNVSVNKAVVQQSRSTTAPIKYVPYVVLHINGEPFMRYDGPAELDSLKRFVLEIAQKVTKNRPINTVNQGVKVEEPVPEVPAFTIGVPKNSGPRGEVNYGSFETVYGGGAGTTA